MLRVWKGRPGEYYIGYSEGQQRAAVKRIAARRWELTHSGGRAYFPTKREAVEEGCRIVRAQGEV